MVLLTIVAGVVRIYRVSEVPGGLHGDEALTGLDALRIVQEGWIGPYVGSALGQPSGALYFTALLFKLSEPSIFILHLSMALLGVAGVPAAYLLFRIGFGRWVALFGTVALTFSYWHLFYSRSAYIVISMPLMTTLAAVAVLIALRSSTRWAWLVAGVLLGLGVYSYAGYNMFLAVVAVFLAFVLVLGRDDLKSYVARLAILAVGFVVAVLPMVHMAYSEPDFYFQRHRLFLREPRFEGAETLVDKVSYLGGRAWDAAILPLRYSRVDGVDGMGGKGALDPIFGLLAYAGLAIAVARWRSPPHLLMAISFAVGLSVLMLGTEGAGELRRAFVIVPFVYGLVGVAVITGARWAIRSLKPNGKKIAYAGVAVVLVAAVSLNTWTYFGRIVQEEHLDWVYVSDLVQALDAAHQFDDPGIVYFYAGRWSYDYETRRFLYPHTPGIDRSSEFGDFSLAKLDEGPVTYMLLSPYADEIDTLKEMYPGGETVEEHRPDGSRLFSLYHLP